MTSPATTQFGLRVEDDSRRSLIPRSGQSTVTVSLPQRMVMSAIAGMGGATVCHPLDVIKFQLQVDAQSAGAARMYTGTVDCGRQIFARAGVSGLYSGLSAAYLRQWMYGSGRMGIYSFLFNRYKQENVGAPALHHKLAMGATSGSIGAFIGTPADVALVRMSADNKKPVELRNNYKGVWDCIHRIVKHDGVAGLWKGATITVMRASVMGSCLMGITSQTRQVIRSKDLMKDEGLPIMFVSAFAASVVACGASLPLDVIKSRLQNSQSGKYKNMTDCFKQSVRAEGPLVLWRGFTPALIKLSPYTVISLTLLEKITSLVTGTNAM